MKRALAAILVLLTLAGAAHGFGLGRLGAGFGRLGAGGGASAPQNFINFTPAVMSQFLTAEAAVTAQSRNGTIMALGDSTTGGFDPALGSNYYATSWPVQLAALNGYATDSMMDNISGAAGTFTTLQNFDSRVTGTAANWAGSGNQSLIGQLWQPSSTTSFTFTPSNAIDTVEIRTGAFAGGSATPFLANIDGGTDTSILNTNASAILRMTPLTTTLGSHAINLHVATATGGAGQQFNSFVAYNSAVKKFNILNCGLNGAKVANLTTSGVAWSTLNVITGWPADLVIIMIGINDWVALTNLTTFSTSLNSVISAAKAGGSSVIVMSPPPSNSTITAYAVQATYVAAMKTAALSAGVAFIDIWDLAGGTWNTGVPMSDNLHPTVPGYATIAGWVQEGLALLPSPGTGHDLLSQTGVPLLAQTGTPILVQ